MPATAARRSEPAQQPGGISVTVRLSPADLSALDAWIEDQNGPKPSRAEAIRRILNQGIGAFDEHARNAIRVSELNSGNDV
ncbi:MAG: hypothetical protein K0S06_2214 [Microvirga sp.]|jgi:hypothetical protein|nr:hypothetical protein [Microvirga sp.]